MPRPLHEIAKEITADWKNKNVHQTNLFYALPYLDAMRQLDSIQGMYGCDSAKSVVLYFLSNAGSWRGDVAKRIKAELNQMVK